MGFQEISEIIMGAFDTLAQAESLEYRVDNDSRDNPNTSIWARALVEEVEYNKIAQNGGDYNYHSEGIFIIELFTRPGTGSKTAMDLSDTLRDGLNDAELGSGKVFLNQGRIIKTGNLNGNYRVDIIFDYLGDVQITV